MHYTWHGTDVPPCCLGGEMVPRCTSASLHLEYEPDQVDTSMAHSGGSECFARVYIATNNQDAVSY